MLPISQRLNGHTNRGVEREWLHRLLTERYALPSQNASP
jgi:hypothetical protein